MRGFGATVGGGTTDKITAQLTSWDAIRSVSFIANRRLAAPVSFARMIEGNTPNMRVFTLQGASPQYQITCTFDTQDGHWTFPAPLEGTDAYITFTHDGSSDANDPIVYVNGSSVVVTRAQAPIGTISTVFEPWILGNRGSDDRVWDGSLGEFAVWLNRILTANEAAAIAKGYSPLYFKRGLEEYVPMVNANQSLWNAQPTIVGTTVLPHVRVIPERPRMLGMAA